MTECWRASGWAADGWKMRSTFHVISVFHFPRLDGLTKKK